MNDIIWGGSGIEQCLYEYVINTFKKKSTMIEFGSGLVSTKVFSDYFNLFSIDDNVKYINKFNCNYILASIKDGWYDADIVFKNIPKVYDVVFIDGPSGTNNRNGILEHVDKFSVDATYIFHDTYRHAEKELCKKFADKIGKKIKFFEVGDYWSVVNEPSE